MPDDLDLMQLASTGQLVARVDDVDYLAVQSVLAWERNGTVRVFCAYADWPQTLPARLAAKEQELLELAATLEKWAVEATDQARRAEAAEQRVKELERQVVAPPETPRQNQERMLQAQHAKLGSDTATEVGPCPECGKDDWKSARALQMHRQRVHQGMQTFKAAPAQFVEELGWRCAAKGCSGAHARDLHDPAFCTLHAQRQIINGVEVAA